MINPKQKTVLQTIAAWSENRPNWQQEALRRITIKGKLDATDIKNLIQLCKQEITLQEGKSSVFNPFEIGYSLGDHNLDHSISLISISDVKDINHLAANQNLNFEKNGLNIVYGENGAGKSGYVRILKRACRARHRGQIHPNIYENYVPNRKTKASAAIQYSQGIDDAKQVCEKWETLITRIPAFPISVSLIETVR